MNDDLKAYVDGELPPDAAERLRARLATDPALALEGEEFRRLSAALRALPEPMPVGQAATIAALANRRPLWRAWVPALAGCAAALLAVSMLPSRAASAPAVQAAVFVHEQGTRKGASPEPAIPSERRAEFASVVKECGGTIKSTADGLIARYPESAHERVLRKFGLPESTAWRSGGIRVRVGG